MRTALLALALLASTPLAASSSHLAGLPAGRIKVDVMKTVTAPQPTELTAEKLHSLISGERGGWQVSAQSGEAVQLEAWEQRLAMTVPPRSSSGSSGSSELLGRASEMVFEKTGEAVIELVPTADGRMMLQADASLPELSGIVLDVVNDTVETPFGRTTEVAEVSTNPDRFAPGAWSGTQWQLDAPGDGPSLGTSIKFAIGRLADDRTVLKYEAKQVEDGKMPRRANYLIVLQ
ncbi:MAG TPA: hypothetical protein VF432_10595 [Thermoanaerobaculia bacterium]